MHLQIISHAPSQMSWRVLSCFCSAPNTCNCFTPETVKFQSWDESTSSASAPSQGTSTDGGGLQIILDLNDALIGQWCAVIYDGDVYPGIIQDVDRYSGAEVKTMTSIGRNRFYWPMRDDVIWYAPMDIIGLIPEPVPVTKRHMKIKMAVWEEICKIWP